ncbi:hypothetical protein MHYP_G00285410 [Metynnis hypsauchen]
MAPFPVSRERETFTRAKFESPRELSICRSLKGCPVILDKLESPSRQTGFRALKPHSTIFRLVETCLTGRNTSGSLGGLGGGVMGKGVGPQGDDRPEEASSR